MQKIFFIIILKLLLQQFGYAQNQVVSKIIIPVSTGLGLIKKSSTVSVIPAFNKLSIAPERVNKTLFSFTDKPLIHVTRRRGKKAMFFAELACCDMLQNALNNLKPDLINTYDDQLTELFKDAPSLVKVKYVIPF